MKLVTFRAWNLDVSNNDMLTGNNIKIGPFDVSISYYIYSDKTITLEGKLLYTTSQVETPVAIHILLNQGADVPTNQESLAGTFTMDKSRPGFLLTHSLMMISHIPGKGICTVAVEWLNAIGHREFAKSDVLINW